MALCGKKMRKYSKKNKTSKLQLSQNWDVTVLIPDEILEIGSKSDTCFSTKKEIHKL